MFEIGSAVAKIKADTSEFEKGIHTVGEKTNGLGSIMSKLGGIIATTFSVYKLIDFGKKASQEAMNLERAMISLEIISEKFGVSATEATKKADELGRSLRIGVSASANSLQNLLKSGLNLDQATELMKRFANEAITGKSANISLAQAVDNLSFAYATGNSALGNMSGISENWIDITDRGREALIKQGIAQKDITDEMAKFKGVMDLTNLTLGSSERFQGTLIDKQAILGQSIIDLKVKVGEQLNPKIAELTDKLNSVVLNIITLVDKIPELGRIYEEHKGIINGVATVLTVFFIPALISIGVQAGISAIGGVASLILGIITMGIEGWKTIAMFIVKIVQLGIATAAMILHTTVTIAQTVATGALTAATWLFNAALAFLTSPIGLVVLAITALIAIGVLLWKNWDTVKQKGSELWKFLTDGFWSFVGALKNIGGKIYDALKEPFENAWNTIKGIMDRIKDALDFTKRHSPSVIDIIDKGVNLANKAFSGLTTTIEPISHGFSPSIAAVGTNGAIINISLEGAFISDEFGARSMAERVGDLIIGKLQSNIKL